MALPDKIQFFTTDFAKHPSGNPLLTYSPSLRLYNSLPNSYGEIRTTRGGDIVVSRTMAEVFDLRKMIVYWLERKMHLGEKKSMIF